MLDVVIKALKWAKENECTRFPNGNGYKGEGFSALEAVNKAFVDNGINAPGTETPLVLKKAQLTTILNTNQMKELELTRFDGINNLRKERGGSGTNVLAMFGLTAAPKQHRAKKDAVETAEAPVASPVVNEEPVSGTGNDFDDF